MLLHSYSTKLFPDLGLMSLVAEVTNQFVRSGRERLLLKTKSIHFNQHQYAVYFSLHWENFIDICSLFIFSLREQETFSICVGKILHWSCQTKLLYFMAATSCVFTSMHWAVTEGYPFHCGICRDTLMLPLDWLWFNLLRKLAWKIALEVLGRVEEYSFSFHISRVSLLKEIRGFFKHYFRD